MAEEDNTDDVAEEMMRMMAEEAGETGDTGDAASGEGGTGGDLEEQMIQAAQDEIDTEGKSQSVTQHLVA